MSNKEFVWTDELVRECCENDKLGLTFKTYVKYFKEMKTPKPLFTTTDGVKTYIGDTVYSLYSGGGTFYFTINEGLHSNANLSQTLLFSTEQAAKAYYNLHKKQFSLADVRSCLQEGKDYQYHDTTMRNLTKLAEQK